MPQIRERILSLDWDRHTVHIWRHTEGSMIEELLTERMEDVRDERALNLAKGGHSYEQEE